MATQDWRSVGARDGLAMVELLGMVLDFLDALAGAVAIAFWWCTWVSPNRKPTRLEPRAHRSGGPEIGRFLLEIQRCPGSRKPR
jgi:hypothetical protein